MAAITIPIKPLDVSTMRKPDNRPRPAFSRRRLLTLLLLGGGLIGGGAEAAGCQPAPPPALKVEVSSDQVREVFDTTVADIRRLAAARGLLPHWPGLGAYVAQLRYRADIDEDAEADRGVYCATPRSVRLVILLNDRVIHLARELQANPCLRDAVRQHTRRHARADEDALNQLPTLTGHLRDALARLPPARGDTELFAKSAATAAVRAQIDDFLDRLDGIRAALNQAIDAPEAIEQLRGKCGPGGITRTDAPSPQRAGG